MKEILERHRSRLADAERGRIWERVRSGRARPADLREGSLRRWSVSFAVAVALVVAAVALGLRERRHRPAAPGDPKTEIVERGRISAGPAGPRQLLLDPGAASDAPVYSSTLEGERRFVSPRVDSLSTFALAVSDRSYDLANQYLRRGSLPPGDAVRIEEFVNALPQGIPSFGGSDLRVFVDGAPAPFGDRTQIVRIVVKAPGIGGESIGVMDPVAEVRFDSRRVARYRLLGFDTGREREADPTAAEPDLRAGEEIVALYEIRLAPGAPEGPIVRARVRYRVAGGDPSSRSAEGMLTTSQLHPFYATAPAHLRLAAAVADFAEVLRGSPWTRDHGIDDVAPIVLQIAAELRDETGVTEFAAMVRMAEAIEARGTGADSPAGDSSGGSRL